MSTYCYQFLDELSLEINVNLKLLYQKHLCAHKYYNYKIKPSLIEKK